MNNASVLIARWYLFLSILCLIAPISASAMDVVPGLLLAWLVLFAFALGNGRLKRNRGVYLSRQVDYKMEVVIVLLAAFCSIYAAKFYTGQILSTVFQAVTSDLALYSSYQQYFVDNSISVLSIKKVPAIISVLFVKMSLLFIYIRNIATANSRNRWSWSIVVLVSLTYVYLSVARGTSFELFEIALLFLFCTFYRGLVVRESYRGSLARYLPVVIVILMFILIFNYNISIRYSFEYDPGCVTEKICYDQNTLIATYFPAMGLFAMKLSGYFVAGIVYTSYLIGTYWLSSIHEFVQLLLPLSSISADLHLGHLCNAALDCGVTWSPGIETFIYTFGFVLLMPIFYILGRFCHHLTKSAMETASFVDIALLYFVILMMISLPVGRFIEVSSSNTMSLAILLSVWMYRKYKKILFRRVRS